MLNPHKILANNSSSLKGLYTMNKDDSTYEKYTAEGQKVT